MFEFHISEDHARRIHELAKDSLASHKNWILSAVERGDLPYAQKLAKEARQLQELFAGFNISAKYEIAKATGKGVERKRVIV
jgi:hypothetical protein